MDYRISELLCDVRVASERQDAYGLLPDVISVLEQIQIHLEATPPNQHLLARGAGALGRVVTDSYEFSESELGTRLLQLVHDLAVIYGKPSRR